MFPSKIELENLYNQIHAKSGGQIDFESDTTKLAGQFIVSFIKTITAYTHANADSTQVLKLMQDFVNMCSAKPGFQSGMQHLHNIWRDRPTDFVIQRSR